MANTLASVVAELERIAPLGLAESWDNVGLLIAPAEPSAEEIAVERALLTIDLTETVLAEALELGAQLVVAYHPVIFGGLKRLRRTVPMERVVLRAVRSAISVYSPHTALDAARDGVNDWLAEALGPGPRVPLAPREGEPELGMGRTVTLDQPAPLAEVVARIKGHLGLEHVRVAASARHEAGEPIHSAAVCAGAGGSLFEGVRGMDLLLTGEMRHHDVLARAAGGTSVVLCDHTNTERGYLPRLAERLRGACSGLEVVVSRRDRDPLAVQ